MGFAISLSYAAIADAVAGSAGRGYKLLRALCCGECARADAQVKNLAARPGQHCGAVLHIYLIQ